MEQTNNTRMFFILDSDNDIVEKLNTREELESYLETNTKEIEMNGYTVHEVNKLEFKVTNDNVVLATPDGRKRNRGKAERDPVTGKALRKDGKPYKSRKSVDESLAETVVESDSEEIDEDANLPPYARVISKGNNNHNPEDVSF